MRTDRRGRNRNEKAEPVARANMHIGHASCCRTSRARCACGSSLTLGKRSMTVPKHLTYDSLEAWHEGERLPKDWTKHSDAHQRAAWFQQFAELKQHLWEKHIASLSEAERKQFADRTHPSLSHRFKDRAAPFLEALKQEFARLGYTAEVSLGFYHLDRIVLSASLDRTPPGRLRGVPWLFRGFEIKYRFPDTQ
jgi:hypothetical protein